MHRTASWPSVKTSASTVIVSPTTRFTENRPQSISGTTLSMTARMRPSWLPRRNALTAFFGALAFMLEVHHAKRRKRYANRMIPAVGGNGRGVYAARVPNAAPGVARRVRIQDFAPETRLRDAEE